MAGQLGGGTEPWVSAIISSLYMRLEEVLYPSYPSGELGSLLVILRIGIDEAFLGKLRRRLCPMLYWMVVLGNRGFRLGIIEI